MGFDASRPGKVAREERRYFSIVSHEAVVAWAPSPVTVSFTR
jgi:hypothetical protein